MGSLPRRWIAATFSTRPELLVLAAVGVFLRLRQYASGRSLWLDEATFANNFVDHDLGWLLSHQLDGYQSAPPGFLGAVKSLSWVLGTSDQALRVIPLISGLLLVGASVVLARTVLDSRLARAALVGLVAFSPVLVYYSSEIKQYGSDAAVTGVLLTLVAVRRRWPAALQVLWLFGIFAVWVSLPSAFTLASIGIVLGLEALRERRYRRVAALGVSWGASTALAAYWSLTTTSGRDVLGAYWVDGMAPFSFREYGWYWSRAVRLVELGLQADGPPLRFMPLDGLMWPQIMLALAALVGLVFGLRQSGPLGDVSRVAVLSIGCALAASMLGYYPFDSRLLIFAVPFVLLALAVAVEAVDRLTPIRHRRTAGIAALAAVLALPAVVSFRHAVHPYDESDILFDLRYIEREGPDLPIVAAPWSDSALKFYDRQFPFAWPVERPMSTSYQVEPLLEWAADTQPGPTWILLSHRFPEGKQAVNAISEFAPIVQSAEHLSAGVYLVDFDAVFAERYRQGQNG